MSNQINDGLTDEEREGMEDLAADGEIDTTPEPEEPADDRPWLAADREAMKGLLTDEELEALKDDEDEGGDDDPAPEQDSAGDDTTKQAADPDPVQQPAAEPAAATAGLTAEELAEVKAATRSELDKLQDQYDDGELTRDELRQKQAAALAAEDQAVQDAIARKSDALEAERAEAFVTTHREAAKVFFAKNPALQQDSAVLMRFDTLQQQVQNDPDFAGKNSMEIFAEAKARLVDEANRKGQSIPGVTDAPKRPTHATRQLPPNMADIPAVASNTPPVSRLAAIAAKIDSADTITGEKIMASLTPEERDMILEGNY